MLERWQDAWVPSDFIPPTKLKQYEQQLAAQTPTFIPTPIPAPIPEPLRPQSPIDIPKPKEKVQSIAGYDQGILSNF